MRHRHSKEFAMPLSVVDFLSTTELEPVVHKPQSKHPIGKCTIPYSDAVWFCKRMKDEDEARTELLTQEFFRANMPWQPLTRLAATANDFYILSSEITGFAALPMDKQEAFCAGRYKGLGQTLVFSLVFQDIDVKMPGNIGTNSSNYVFKIDGDMAFASVRFPLDYAELKRNITPQLIAALPRPAGYQTWNWLDYVSECYESESAIFCPELASSPFFRREINQAILQMIILPDWYINCFCSVYIPDKAAIYSAFIRERRDQFRHSALQLDFFRAYLGSADAMRDVVGYLHQLSKFKIDGLQRLLNSEDKQKLLFDITNIFTELSQTNGVDVLRAASWPRMSGELLLSFTRSFYPFPTAEEQACLNQSLGACYYPAGSTASSSMSVPELIDRPQRLVKLIADTISAHQTLVEPVIQAYVTSLHQRHQYLALAVIASGLGVPFSHLLAKCFDPTPLIDTVMAQCDEFGENLLLRAVDFESVALKCLLPVLKSMPVDLCFDLMQKTTENGCNALLLSLYRCPEYFGQILQVTSLLPEPMRRTVLNQKQGNGIGILSALARHYPSSLGKYFSFCHAWIPCRDHVSKQQYHDETQQVLAIIRRFHPEKSAEVSTLVNRYAPMSPYVQWKFFRKRPQPPLVSAPEEKIMRLD